MHAMSDTSPTPFQWRPMTAADLAQVDVLAQRIHPDFPERIAVLAEKFELFPDGCFVLGGPDAPLSGYCFSHPWRGGQPPALDTFLTSLPDKPDAHFIHDVTVDASLRRRSLASVLVPKLVEVARAIPVSRMILVAVSGSGPFWTRMGFLRTDDDALQAATRAKYGAGAMHMQRELT